MIFSVDPAVMHTTLVKERTKFDRTEGITLLVISFALLDIPFTISYRMIRSVFGGGLLGFTGNTIFTRYALYAYAHVSSRRRASCSSKGLPSFSIWSETG
jgi:hypothetical protein